jgi:hypothetical protein
LKNSVCWDSDFDFEDFGYEGVGVVHICHCANCGAEIEYKVPSEESTGKKTYGSASERLIRAKYLIKSSPFMIGKTNAKSLYANFLNELLETLEGRE